MLCPSCLRYEAGGYCRTSTTGKLPNDLLPKCEDILSKESSIFGITESVPTEDVNANPVGIAVDVMTNSEITTVDVVTHPSNTNIGKMLENDVSMFGETNVAIEYEEITADVVTPPSTATDDVVTSGTAVNVVTGTTTTIYDVVMEISSYTPNVEAVYPCRAVDVKAEQSLYDEIEYG